MFQVNIAKQYSPFGFHVTLEAATAQWVRKEEDRCTYLNKVSRRLSFQIFVYTKRSRSIFVPAPGCFFAGSGYSSQKSKLSTIYNKFLTKSHPPYLEKFIYF